jgi:basic membrane protein A
MHKNLARGLLLAGFAAALAVVVRADDRPPLKVGFVYVTPIGEAGWTYQHDQGRLAMEKALGARVSTSVVEAVAEGPDAERVMRDLATQGHKLIFATSFGYLEPALRVAAEFPAVAFEQTGGYKTAPNVNTYNARYYEGRYLAGLLAGKLSRSGVAGYVAGFPVPEVIQGINAFALGLRAANPKATVKVLWLDTWFDPAREREAAIALVNQGADVLTNHSGSTAVAQLAEERKVGVIAYQSDMSRIAPHAQLTAIIHQWGGYYTQVAQQVLDGTWRAKPVWGGMKDSFVQLAPLNPAVPKDVAAFVQARKADLIAGRLQPFAGRIVDREGRVRQDHGAMADAQIATMNYFVEGVVGSLPRP